MAKKIFKDSEAPVYEIVIGDDDNTGIRLVSLVTDPAIEIQGMAFSKEETIKFEFKNVGDKQMIVGPALIPNKKIARKDEDGDLYFVYFTEDTIRLMVEKFNRENNNKSINIDHSKQMVKSGYIQQNWIIEDSYYDKSKMYGYNLPVGSWFIEVKIDDKSQWMEYVKDGGRYSFSVEGLMGQKATGYSFESMIDSLDESDIMDIMSSLKKKRISFDFDGTLDQEKVQKIAKAYIDNNYEVFIITKNSFRQDIIDLGKKIGINTDHIIFTNHNPKWMSMIVYNIDIHYDDMKDEIDEIEKNTKTICKIV